MNFFKSGLSKVRQTKTKNGMKLTEKTKGLYETTKTKLNETKDTIAKTVQDQKALYFQIHPTKISDFLTEIMDNVYFMPFPEKGVIEKYSNILNEAFEENYKIWNVSEYTYETKMFNDQVMDYINTGYPNPSLVELFMICKEMINWLNSDESNVVIIHCQRSRSRSALVLSCLIYELGIQAHPCAALTQICSKLSFNEQSFLKTCNHVYANYYSLMSSNVRLNSKKIKIKKIMLSEAPEITLKPEHKRKESVMAVQKILKPYVQFFANRSIVYNSFEKDKGFPLIDDEQPVIFKPDQLVDGDVLIRVRHFLSKDVRYPVMRIMLNSCMLVNENTRFHSSDLDLGDSITVSDDFYVDVIIETLDEESDSWDIVQKIREDQKASKVKQARRPKLKLSVKSYSSQDDDDLFEINDSPLRRSGSSKSRDGVDKFESPIDIKTPNDSSGRVFDKNTTPAQPAQVEAQDTQKSEEVKVPEKQAVENTNQEEEEEEFVIDEDGAQKQIEEIEQAVKTNNDDDDDSEEDEDSDEDSDDEETGEIDMEEYLKKLENEAK